ncbi:hypothetical protein AHF37_11652 [Paragonimus kellicotti]|nr:hypothetical protein AHF37_11652 [Paragonimus kellicotti]
MQEGFGKLTSCLQSVALIAHDNIVIPGGPLRALVYLKVRKPSYLMEVKLTIEQFHNFQTSKTAISNREKTASVSYSCLTSNVRTPCRSVPRKFTYDLPEFKLSALSCIDQDDPRIWPFRGPILLQAGYYSIPCTVSIPATQHPTVVLRQNVTSAHWFALDHS